MSYYEKTERITLPVSADLSAAQYKFMTLGATGLALQDTSAAACVGVLDTNDASVLGKRAPLAVGGVTKVMAGAVVAIGAKVMSNDAGLAITATGTGAYIQGTALEAAAASGDIIAVLLDKEGQLN